MPQNQLIGPLCASRPSSPTFRARVAHRDKTITSEQRLALLSDQIRSAEEEDAQILVLPEMIFDFDPQIDHTVELQSLAAETNAYLVIGYVMDDEQRFRNETIVLSPSGNFLDVYSKTHPMITSSEPETISADHYPIYDTHTEKLVTGICFDANFTDMTRCYGRQDAQLIAVPSLFGAPLAEFSYTQTVFRVIENRVAIIMTDVAYNFAMVDPVGHILQLDISPSGNHTTLITDVSLGTGGTWYSELGDWLGWLNLTSMLFFIVIMRWKPSEKTK